MCIPRLFLSSLCHLHSSCTDNSVDTVVMNPPFGTRVRGADMGFLRAGLTIARNAVYSLHKTSTRSHIEKHALLTLRAKSATVLAELRYELPKVYKHHRMDSVEIEVDLWMFEPPEDGIVGGGRWTMGMKMTATGTTTMSPGMEILI